MKFFAYLGLIFLVYNCNNSTSSLTKINDTNNNPTLTFLEKQLEVSVLKEEKHTLAGDIEVTKSLEQIGSSNIYVESFHLMQHTDVFDNETEDTKKYKTKIIANNENYFLNTYFNSSHEGILSLPPFNYVLYTPHSQSFGNQNFIVVGFTHQYDGAENARESMKFIFQCQNDSCKFIAPAPQNVYPQRIADFNQDGLIDFIYIGYDCGDDYDDCDFVNKKLDFYSLDKGKFYLRNSYQLPFFAKINFNGY